MSFNIQSQLDNVSASLPDMQRAFEALDEALINTVNIVQQNILSFGDRSHEVLSVIKFDFHQEVSDLPFTFANEVDERCTQLETELKDIMSFATALAEKLGELVDTSQAFEDNIAELQQQFLDADEELKKQFAECAASVEEVVSVKSDALVEYKDETCAEFSKLFDEALNTDIKGGFEAVHEDAITRLSKYREECFSFVDDMADQLQNTVQNELSQTVDNIEQMLERRIKNTGDEVKDTLIREVQEEAARIVITTQMGAQITTMLQPYLPQLMAANMLAPSIQAALKIMRMGF